MWTTVCRGNEEYLAHQNEWTPLRHQVQKDGQAGPHHRRRGGERFEKITETAQSIYGSVACSTVDNMSAQGCGT